MDRQSVEKFINDRIKPALESHGGGIKLVDVKSDNTVVVSLTGACGGCPSAMMTLKHGVEASLKEAFPELKSVVAL